MMSTRNRNVLCLLKSPFLLLPLMLRPSRLPLGDQKLIMSVPYYIDDEMLWSRGDLFEQPVRATLYGMGSNLWRLRSRLAVCRFSSAQAG